MKNYSVVGQGIFSTGPFVILEAMYRLVELYAHP